MQYLGIIIPLVVVFVLARIIYGIFESSGFKGVVSFKMTLEIILLIISMILNSVTFNFQTILAMFKVICIVFVLILISTALELWAYNKSTSFFSFIMYNILFGLIISLVLTAVLFIVLCFINPILLTNKMVKIIFIILLSILAIFIICSIVKFILNMTTESNMPDKIENNEKIINEAETPAQKESLMLFCPNCGFKLDKNTKFCIGCGKYFYNKRN